MNKQQQNHRLGCESIGQPMGSDSMFGRLSMKIFVQFVGTSLQLSKAQIVD